MCCFNDCFQSKPKLKSQAVYRDARLQKPKRRRKVVFNVRNVRYINMYFLKTSKNSEIRVKKEGEKIKEKVS